MDFDFSLIKKAIKLVGEATKKKDHPTQEVPEYDDWFIVKLGSGIEASPKDNLSEKFFFNFESKKEAKSVAEGLLKGHDVNFGNLSIEDNKLEQVHKGKNNVASIKKTYIPYFVDKLLKLAGTTLETDTASYGKKPFSKAQTDIKPKVDWAQYQAYLDLLVNDPSTVGTFLDPLIAKNILLGISNGILKSDEGIFFLRFTNMKDVKLIEGAKNEPDFKIKGLLTTKTTGPGVPAQGYSFSDLAQMGYAMYVDPFVVNPLYPQNQYDTISTLTNSPLSGALFSAVTSFTNSPQSVFFRKGFMPQTPMGLNVYLDEIAFADSAWLYVGPASKISSLEKVIDSQMGKIGESKALFPSLAYTSKGKTENVWILEEDYIPIPDLVHFPSAWAVTPEYQEKLQTVAGKTPDYDETVEFPIPPSTTDDSPISYILLDDSVTEKELENIIASLPSYVVFMSEDDDNDYEARILIIGDNKEAYTIDEMGLINHLGEVSVTDFVNMGKVQQLDWDSFDESMLKTILKGGQPLLDFYASAESKFDTL